MKIIDLDNYPRKKHFEYFKTLAYPYVGITSDVDITSFYHHCRKHHYPFFYSLLYCVVRSTNQIEAFRQRIQDDQIVEYDYCESSFTIMLEDNTFRYCISTTNQPYVSYLENLEKMKNNIKTEGTLEEQDSLEYFYVSCLPWVSFTSLIQPTPYPADSNPRITWGKFIQQQDKIILPMSILAHHALVDGLHLAQFYMQLEKELETFVNE